MSWPACESACFDSRDCSHCSPCSRKDDHFLPALCSTSSSVWKTDFPSLVTNPLWCDHSSSNRMYGLSAWHPFVLEFVVFQILFQTILIDFTTVFQYARCLIAYGDNHVEDCCCIFCLSPVRYGKFNRHLLSFYCAISKL